MDTLYLIHGKEFPERIKITSLTPVREPSLKEQSLKMDDFIKAYNILSVLLYAQRYFLTRLLHYI
jgi:hypothetical protein